MHSIGCGSLVGIRIRRPVGAPRCDLCQHPNARTIKDRDSAGKEGASDRPSRPINRVRYKCAVSRPLGPVSEPESGGGPAAALAAARRRWCAWSAVRATDRDCAASGAAPPPGAFPTPMRSDEAILASRSAVARGAWSLLSFEISPRATTACLVDRGGRAASGCDLPRPVAEPVQGDRTRWRPVHSVTNKA